MHTLLAFLDRIEGSGYGGMADFEIARTEAKEASAALTEIVRVGTWTGTDEKTYTSQECRIASRALGC